MYNRKLLEAEIVKSGFSKKEISTKLGMSLTTFYRKIKDGTFDILECRKLVDLLKIENPTNVFFS